MRVNATAPRSAAEGSAPALGRPNPSPFQGALASRARHSIGKISFEAPAAFGTDVVQRIDTEEPESGWTKHRTMLHDHLRSYKDLKVFPKAVHAVNQYLAESGDRSLSAGKAQSYREDTERVQSGEMNNTTAFVRSAGGWAGEGRYGPAFLNMLGAVFVGAPADHQERYIQPRDYTEKDDEVPADRH